MRAYHFCAEHRLADGSTHTFDGVTTSSADPFAGAEFMEPLRAQIAAAMTPPRAPESVTIRSLTVLAERFDEPAPEKPKVNTGLPLGTSFEEERAIRWVEDAETSVMTCIAVLRDNVAVRSWVGSIEVSSTAWVGARNRMVVMADIEAQAKAQAIAKAWAWRAEHGHPPY